MRYTCTAAMVMAAMIWSCAGEGNSDYFVVRVIDDQTGLGVPMVSLRLPNEVEYWTDSAGVSALSEPTSRSTPKPASRTGRERDSTSSGRSRVSGRCDDVMLRTFPWKRHRTIVGPPASAGTYSGPQKTRFASGLRERTIFWIPSLERRRSSRQIADLFYLPGVVSAYVI